MRRLQRLLAGISVAALAATGCDWHLSTLDGPGSALPGHTENGVSEQGNTAIVYNGAPHVFYADATDDSLRHAYWNGVAWAFEVLDGTGATRPGTITDSLGRYPAAVLYNGRPHVFYWDYDAGALRHAYYNGVTWAFETLDGPGATRPGTTTNDVGDRPSVTLYNGRPHVFYYDNDNLDLRHAYYNGVTWAFETLDGPGATRPGTTTNDVGAYSAAVLYNSRPHVFYWDGDDHTLRHAYYNGATWAFETLDGTGALRPGTTTNDVGNYVSVALYNGRPHVFYLDDTDNSLRHAYYNGVTWVFETLDGTGATPRTGTTSNPVGQYTSVVAYGSRLEVFYYDFFGHGLRHASHDVGWTFQVLDGEDSTLAGATGNATGRYSAPLSVGGKLHVFYWEAASDYALRHAWFG